MKWYIYIFLLTNLHFATYGQVVRGIVLNEQTHDAISDAAVYFAGTFVGTTADVEGNFELDITHHASRPLTISAVGYYSYSLTDFTPGEIDTVYLKPKVYEIGEVVISTKSLERKRKINLNIFRKEFLGTSFNARRCRILNEEDITFNYHDDTDTLKAFASQPILVENKALGYHVTYYLNEFLLIRRSRTIYLTGDIFFNEDMTDLYTDIRTYERRRRYAYTGSCMHFFRSLWANDLGSGNFRIKIPGGADLSCQQVVVKDEDGRKYFTYPEDLEIWYFSNYSHIEFLKEHVFFEQNGYYDPVGILWRGPMSKQRVGDWLPYEYILGD